MFLQRPLCFDVAFVLAILRLAEAGPLGTYTMFNWSLAAGRTPDITWYFPNIVCTVWG